jgi:hypothetical protein
VLIATLPGSSNPEAWDLERLRHLHLASQAQLAAAKQEDDEEPDERDTIEQARAGVKMAHAWILSKWCAEQTYALNRREDERCLAEHGPWCGDGGGVGFMEVGDVKEGSGVGESGYGGAD